MKKPKKTIMLWGAAAVAVVGALCFPSPSSGQAAAVAAAAVAGGIAGCRAGGVADRAVGAV